MKNNVLAIVLALTLAFCCIPMMTSCSIAVDHTQYFYFNLIDETTYIRNDDSLNYLEQGTYMATGVNGYLNHPKNLIVPSEYMGKKVTAIGSDLLDRQNVETLIIPKTIKIIGANMCGYPANCHSLEKIVCLGDEPFYLGSFSLNESQLKGGCKIYVPDDVIDKYKSFDAGVYSLSHYSNLILPYSQLDESTRSYIEANVK